MNEWVCVCVPECVCPSTSGEVKDNFQESELSYYAACRDQPRVFGLGSKHFTLWAVLLTHDYSLPSPTNCQSLNASILKTCVCHSQT